MNTGETRLVQVFVACLGASGYLFAVAVESQTIADWLKAHTLMLTHLGGVFDIPEAEFSALNAEVQAKRINTLPTNELIQGIYQELGLHFTSERIKSGFINGAINIALRGRPRALLDKLLNHEREDIDLNKAIKMFSTEMAFLDSIKPKPDIFVTGVLVGALIILGTHRDLQAFFYTPEQPSRRAQKLLGRTRSRV